jgi:hypothetical protein
MFLMLVININKRLKRVEPFSPNFVRKYYRAVTNLPVTQCLILEILQLVIFM